MTHKLATALLAATIYCSGLNAQNGVVQGQQTYPHCGTPLPPAEWDKEFNELVKQYQALNTAGKSAATAFTIPVIVHVIHAGQNIGTYPNISQAQVNSQIPVLNNDFAGTGFNVGSVPSAFSSLVDNTDIKFCMAQLDPSGNCLVETGIDRVDYRTIAGATNPAGASSPSSIMSLFDNIIKPATIWDPRYYLNIWVSDVGSTSGILGYASFPANSTLSGIFGTGGPNNDGVWVWSRAFGTTGSVQWPYNRGRTATHETGHWLGLRHINGDGNCATDYCNDTPTQQALNYGCPNYPQITCSNGPSGDMFMNFMDYCDDACLYMFTPDQTARMHAALNFGTYRNQLTTSSASLCDAPSASPSALFSLSSNSVCIDSVTIGTNLSTGMPCPTYSWSVNPPAGVTFTPNASYGNPKIKFTTPGFYTVTMVATNSLGTHTAIDYVDVVDCFNVEGLAEQMLFNSGVSVQPNPGNGLFNISMRYTYHPETNLSLYNSVGALISEKTYTMGQAQTIELNLSDLPKGVYYLKLKNGEYQSSKKLVLME